MKIKPNDSNIFKKIVVLFTVFISTVLYSQTYPVQVTPQLIPPYSLKMSDYATTTSEKLYTNILLTDVNEVGRRIRLKMYIEGQGLSITTQDVIAGETPIYVDGGINLRLSNLDLQAYFQLNNLVGITPGQYNAPLPNGGYDFCFEVYDYFTNRKLSAKSCTTVYLLQNDPPILNLPFKDNIVNATNPQNILFTWTPRHSNASNVQYEFTLKELWNVQNPQANFLASVPFYQTTTYSTTLLVGPEAPQLLSGKIYGWQVRAFVSDGINETSVFKNDGKSEIFWFKYLEDCQPPSFVISQALTAESVQVNWQSAEHLRYRIQYRKKGFGDDDWFEVNSYTNEGKIRNLEPATVYEFRVGGECTQLSGFAYSNIQEFTTPSNDEAAYYNCGLTPQINITNKEPLPKLGINETFTAGDFPVTTREVIGSNGTFSGWGYITLPFLENLKEIIDAANIATGGKVNIGKYTRIKVVFEHVQVNSSYELIEGVVETDYDPEWGGIIDTDEIIDDIGGDRGNIENFDATNTDIKDVKVDENGNVVIIPEEGDPIPIETGKPVTITDKNGDQWTVHEDGKVTEGKAAEGGTPTADNTEGISSAGNVKQISSKDVRVTFTPSGYYGTDTYQEDIKSDKYKSEYEFIKTHDNKDYSVLYKLLSDLPEHKTDIIKATVNFSNGKTKEDIVFKTKEGTAINPTWSGNEATLPLQRKFEFAKEEILATVKPKDSTGKFTVAGKLNVWHAQQQTINLTLVSVDGASVSNVGDRINEIYNKAGIHFNIKTESINLGLGNLDVGDSDMLSNYTEGEKSIISAFKNGRTIAKDQYYMFFLDDKKVTLTKDLDGFMPLKRQFGFVFETSDAGRIAAHELGHGIFGLKHPFDQYDAEEARNENHYLMSYGTGIAFSHMDWQKLHAPGIQLYWFQGDETGESTKVKSIPEEFKNPDGTYTFMTLNSSYITLPNTASDFMFSTGLDKMETFIDYPAGALISFKIGEKKYRVDVSRKAEESQSIVIDDLTFTYKGFEYKGEKYNKYSGSVIMLTPFYKNIYTKGIVTGGSYGYSLNKRKIELEFVEGNSFNLIKNYDKIQKIYGAEIEKSKDYAYTSKAFPHQYELNVNLMNEVIKEGSWTQRHAIVIKYGILNNAQPEIFKKAVKKHFNKDYSVVFKDNDLQSLLDGYIPVINLMKSESKGALEEFYNIVRNHNNGISVVKAYVYDLYKIISKLSSEQIGNIEMNDRKVAFKILLGQEDNKYIFSSLVKNITSIDRYENEILRLVKFVSDKEIDNLINYLEEGVNNKVDKDHLWHFAFHKLDDATFFWNKDNRKNFIRILTNHYYKSQRYKNELQKFKNWDEWKENGNSIALRELKRREIVGDYQSIYERSWNQLKINNPVLFSSFSPAKSYTKYDADYEKTNGKINVEKNYSLGFMYNTKDEFTMAPFDLMYYRNQSTLANLRDYNTKKLIPLPAIVLYYDDNVQALQTTGDAIQLSIDLATLAIPGGQLDKVGRVLYLLDKASSVASISSEVLKNENPEASKLLNVLSIAFGVADLTNITKANSVKKLNNSLEENFNDFKNALEEIEKAQPETIAKLTDNNKKGLKRLIAVESQALKDAGKTVDEAKINSILKKIDAADAVFDITKSYKGVKFDEFVKNTWWGPTEIDTKIKEEVFRLWTKIDGDSDSGVSELYNYMKQNKVNLDADNKTPWPPFNGFLKNPETLNGEDIVKGKIDFTLGKEFDGIYDRFQTPRILENGDVQSIETLGGGFASPVFKGEYNIDIPYTYDSRALLDNVKEGTVYIKFRVKDPKGLIFKYGEAIPWKNRTEDKLQGMAMQVQIDGIKFHSDGFKDKYDIVQKSIYRNGKWEKITEDVSKKVDDIMGNLKKCD
ncbi:fibronectin type III domain-containing protein [Tenacibaculum ascidiaceicola]|uniref:fibronectin type III domain-containing protein n=1 Tax=Tenacibaculum ascidiaceicola TaxID=1699411 RepID=UPI003CE592CF